jgi:hypothetical protein
MDLDQRHLTGHQVQQKGTYICEAGEKRSYEKGELFQSCPITDKTTKWRKLK